MLSSPAFRRCLCLLSFEMSEGSMCQPLVLEGCFVSSVKATICSIHPESGSLSWIASTHSIADPCLSHFLPLLPRILRNGSRIQWYTDQLLLLLAHLLLLVNLILMINYCRCFRSLLEIAFCKPFIQSWEHLNRSSKPSPFHSFSFIHDIISWLLN